MRDKWIILLLAAIICDPTGAVVGCLTPEENLVPRAEIIALGRVTAVDKVKLVECQQAQYFDAHPNRCGGVTRFTISTLESLKGTAPTDFQVWVGSSGPLVLDCDDRPLVGEMSGLTVLLFLELDGGRLWTLDGGNSLHSWHQRPNTQDKALSHVRALIEHELGRPSD